jgi:hypothetical protein
LYSFVNVWVKSNNSIKNACITILHNYL